MYHTIVVPTDGSEHSTRAAEEGLALARRFDATVHVVSVVDVQRAAGIFGAGGIDREFVDRVERVGKERVRAVEALAREGDDVRSTVVRGPPWQAPSVAILEYAADHEADLIVMGTHGRTMVGRALAGSVTERVVRGADAPVLTVRATDSDVPSSYDRILVPTDGSEAATAAVEHAISIARTADALVHALFVVDVGAIAAAPDINPYTVVRDDLEAVGEKATAAIATRVREAGIDAVTAVREGFLPGDLLGYGSDHGIDLIVMGTHGRTGLDRVLLGSTAARVIRRAEVPVLVARQDA